MSGRSDSLGPSGLTLARHDLPGDRAHLTDRELEVLHLLTLGRSSRQIAQELFLSARTVERHVANIYAKLGVQTRAQATAYALRHDLVPPS